MIDYNKIKLIVLDCDGVLTDGKIVYNDDQIESKNFHSQDGLGAKILSFSDIKIAVVTGRKSKILEKRCQDLNITILKQLIRNKRKCIEDILTDLNLSWENVAYMGDDWNDWPAMNKAYFKTAPANAVEDIKTRVDWVSSKNGGEACVRDLINYILTKQGIYEKCIEAFLHHLDDDQSFLN